MASECPKADNWGVSEFEAIKTSYQWVITNFGEIPVESEEIIESPIFSSDKDMKTKWYLEVYPNGLNSKKGFVSIYINLKETDKNKVLSKFRLAIIGGTQHIYRKEIRDQFKDGNGFVGWSEFIRRSKLEKPEKHLLPNNVLTIYCEITYSGECKTTSGQNTGLKRSHNRLLEDMTALHQNPNYSDVEIEVKGHKFSAHKLILMARSSVFAAMFTHQMEEKKQNKVFINDIEKEIFSKVVSEDINSSLQLLSAADKYNLDDLKSICEEYIGSQLTVESVSDVLILADNHSAQELKAKAIDFIGKYRNEVMKTKGWVKVVINRPDLLELF